MFQAGNDNPNFATLIAAIKESKEVRAILITFLLLSL